jgi:glycosyltransferase involved in cell wall biosynthesis
MASVAMVVTNACSPDPRVLRSAKLLAKNGHNVTIHAFDRTQGSPMSEIDDGVRIMRYHIGVFSYGAKWKTVSGLRAFRKTVTSSLANNPPDCVYCHDADTLEIGVKLKSKAGCILIFDMHDLQHTWVMMGRPNSLVRRAIAHRLEKRNLQRIKKSDLVITSSGAAKGGMFPGFSEYLSEQKVDSIVVENRPEEVERRQKVIPNTEWTVAYIGRVREIKSFHLLTKALELLPKSERPNIKIAGDGTATEDVHTHLLNESSRLGIHLNLHPAFDASTLPSLMEDVDVMFAMYAPERGNIKQGALPVKMFDAASFGIPSIVNSDCLMGEVCTNESLGLAVKWGDSEALSAALLSQREAVIALEEFGKEQHSAFLKAFEALF